MSRFLKPERSRGAWRLAGALLALALLLPGGAARAADICGCAGNQESLGAWNSNADPDDPIKWPAIISPPVGNVITITLPEDGMLVFDSFVLDELQSGPANLTLRFERNAANTPVKILVAGDFEVGVGDKIDLDGEQGQDGGQNLPGLGALGGPGGFKGGDGGYYPAGYPNGGAGHGPGGGAPGNVSNPQHGSPPRDSGRGGQFLGSSDLLPMSGGSGGGGGSSDAHSSPSDHDAANGGGGGGGGAVLVAADGILTVNGTISARGGGNGQPASAVYSFGGGGGSGGAIRLVAESVVGSGSLTTVGGSLRGTWGNSGGPGRIRIESYGSSFPANNATPFVTFSDAPGPIVLPFTPTVDITAVGGAPVIPPLGGWRKTSDPAKIDVEVGAAGDTTVQLATSGVPRDTLVRVSAVPYRGAGKTTVNVPVLTCDTNGIVCSASATFNLDPGGYAIEARATFQPAP
jgi:hypothetical protein